MLKLTGIGSNHKPHDLQKLKLRERTQKEEEKKKPGFGEQEIFLRGGAL